MKKLLTAIIPLFVLLACNKGNSHEVGEGFTAHLTLSRQWFTSFPNGVIREEKYETAIANFQKENFNYDGGTVKYGDSVLTKHSLSFYYQSAGVDNILADFRAAYSGGKTWVVEGNSQYDVPACSTIAPNYPTFLYMKFDTLPVVHRNQSFMLSWDGSVPCDSISIGIFQGYRIVQTGVISGRVSSMAFSPSQLAVLQRFEKAYIIIEGRNYNHTKTSGMEVNAETYARRNCEVFVLD